MSKHDRVSQEQLNELKNVGVGGLAESETDGISYDPEMLTRPRHGGYGEGKNAFNENESTRRKVMEPNNFWSTVNMAKEVRLPKPHLTQPDIAKAIEEAMASLNDPGRVSAFRQVMVGVTEGRFCQYALPLFGHNAWTTVEEGDKAGDRHNRMGETRLMLAMLDSIVAEMPDDAGPKKLYAAYGRVVKDLREENGGIDEGRLVDLIRAADEADDPFWVDSRKFIIDGTVMYSNLSLAALVQAGILSVTKTDRGGTKVFVAGWEKFARAIDALDESGFAAAANVLRERTRRRPVKIGSSLDSLAEMSSPSSSEDEDGSEEEPA